MGGDTADEPELVERWSSRVVLVDGQDRILLVRIVDDGVISSPEGEARPSTYWVTPGGGREGDEPIETTARRELFEETGIDHAALGPLLLRRSVAVRFHDRPTLFVEHYFAGYVEDAEATLDHIVPLERDVLVEHRWWTMGDILDPARRERIFPPAMGYLAEAARARVLDRHPVTWPVDLARADDVDGWLAIVRGVEPLFGPMPDFAVTLRRKITNGAALCVRDGDAVLGAVLLGGVAPDRWIRWLAVRGDRRGEGVGAALVSAALDRFGLPCTVGLDTFGADNPDGQAARRLYEHFGFGPGPMMGRGPEGGTRQRFTLTLP